MTEIAAAIKYAGSDISLGVVIGLVAHAIITRVKSK